MKIRCYCVGTEFAFADFSHFLPSKYCSYHSQMGIQMRAYMIKLLQNVKKKTCQCNAIE